MKTTGSRRTGYVIALVVAVLALLGSMAAVGALTLRSHSRAGWSASLSQGGARGGDWWGPGPGGMMRGGGRGGWGTALTQAEATKIATVWVSANQSGAQLGAPTEMPMGWVFNVTRSGARLGALVVFGNGQVRYYPGGSTVAPSPTPSAGSGT